MAVMYDQKVIQATVLRVIVIVMRTVLDQLKMIAVVSVLVEIVVMKLIVIKMIVVYVLVTM